MDGSDAAHPDLGYIKSKSKDVSRLSRICNLSLGMFVLSRFDEQKEILMFICG